MLEAGTLIIHDVGKHLDNNELTNQSHHEDPENDPEGVTDDVHEDNGDESHGQIELALSLFAAPSTQYLTAFSSIKQQLFAWFVIRITLDVILISEWALHHQNITTAK